MRGVRARPPWRRVLNRALQRPWLLPQRFPRVWAAAPAGWRSSPTSCSSAIGPRAGWASCWPGRWCSPTSARPSITCPGMLFDGAGRHASPSPAAPFVLATGLAFILLALKYVEVVGPLPRRRRAWCRWPATPSGRLVGLPGRDPHLRRLLPDRGHLVGVGVPVPGGGCSRRWTPWLVPGACGAIVAAGRAQHRRHPGVGHADRRPGGRPRWW